MGEYRIPLYKAHIPLEAIESLREVLYVGQIARGPNVAKFETMLQNYIGNPYITSTGNISSTIQLCLYMAGVRPGDEVLATPMACLATNMPVKNLFARIVWCDIDPITGNISPNEIESQISLSTKAILVYHWGGNPVNLSLINSIAHKNNLCVVEDASEALGAEYQERKIGNTGTDFTVFSFNAISHITTGEGAAIAFGNKELYERGRWLKRYGIHEPTFRDEWGEINTESDISEVGYNNSMNHLAATIGLTQISRLSEIINCHQVNGFYYDEALLDVPGITLIQRQPATKSAYWVYTLFAERRDDLLKKFWMQGIHASKVHLRNDLYSCFDTNKRELPGVNYFQQHSLSIPCGWWVKPEDREYIVNSICAGW